MRTGAKLGQHFLKHAWAARSLARAAAPRVGEIIVEIGPGKGVLTRELLELGPVVAIEKDTQLIEQLKETFAEDIAACRLRLVESDVRDVTPDSLGLRAEKYVVAANIPYYITGEIIRQFLTSDAQPRAMALLVQKEVAQRIVSTKESLLSLSVKAYGTPRIVERVSKIHFSPPPRVDSAIILISDISKRFFDNVSEEHFFRVLHAGFASKRKFLSNNLANVFDKDRVTSAFKECGVNEKARAEDVPLEGWKGLEMRLGE